MFTIIRGVRIELTPEQIKKIKQAENKLKRCRSSFEKMLRHLGFKQISDLPPGHFEHKQQDWYAEIYNRGCYNDVWMVGNGLKSSGFPGGWNYSSPQEIEEEILKALDNL
jgi:hypothetical protein